MNTYMSFELPHFRPSHPGRGIHVLAVIVLCIAGSGCQSWGGTVLPPDVAANQFEVVPGIYLAGELDERRTREVAAGDALVIDLRTSAEGTAEEAARLVDAGVDYVNFPLASATLDPAMLTSVATLLDRRGDRPVILHCRSGNRAGMVYAALQIRAGASVDDALTSVSPVITSDAVRQAVRDYAEGS